MQVAKRPGELKKAFLLRPFFFFLGEDVDFAKDAIVAWHNAKAAFSHPFYPFRDPG